MSNVLSYQFIPVPRDLKKGIRSLKGNFYRVMDLIIDEIFAFKDTREKLTKEFAYRYVAKKLEINFGNVGRIFRQLQERGFIEILKIGKNKTGSLIRLIFGCTSTTKASPSSCTGTTETNNFSCTGTTIKELKSKEKDHQEKISDSSLNSPEEENQLEENTIKSSPNSESIIEESQEFSKESNSNNPVNNLLATGQVSTGKSDFTSLGSVLNNSTPAPQVNSDLLSEKTITEGKDLLLKKGFSAEEVTTIINRITLAMKEKNIKNREKYFLTSCNKEVRKINNPAGSIHKVTCAALPEKKNNNFNNTVKKWEEEKKNDINPEVIIKKLMTLRPDDLYRVILDVDNSPSGKFISLPEIKASLYIAEFKKRFPEVTV
ncbi:MAG: hypothetical protein ABRQ39_27580 [Candidatus Eremiobacterota bacterium]